MRNSLKIAQAVYQALNDTTLTSEITGELSMNRRPENSESEDVVIIPLSNLNTYVQNGYINVNIYVKDLSNGMPNDDRLSLLADRVTGLIEASNTKPGESYFKMDIDNQIILPEERGCSYVNLRVKFFTEQ